MNILTEGETFILQTTPEKCTHEEYAVRTGVNTPGRTCASFTTSSAVNSKGYLCDHPETNGQRQQNVS